MVGCEIWGFSNLDTIERVHLKFCKLLLHLKKSTPNFMIYGELWTFVLLELTFSFHKLQYSEKLSSCICLSTAESANKTVSSAYYITNILIKISSSFSCNVGVRQGGNVSPFLFYLYLNDLEHFLQSKNSLGLNCITDEIENELDI
jgi:hypothetical protein